MHITDRELLGSEQLDDNYKLQRVINGGGVPYSIILDKDGVEVYSMPTDKETEMIEHWKANKDRG